MAGSIGGLSTQLLKGGTWKVTPLRRLYVRMGEMRNAYKLLVGKPEGKRPLEIPRRRKVKLSPCFK
jgi:hypothetical protein